MISRRDLDRLAALRSDDGIVSVYVGIEPRLRFDRAQAEKKFRGAVKRFLRRSENTLARDAIEREGQRISDALAHADPDGRGLAIFASTPAAVWEQYQFNERVPTFVDADITPNTALLAAIIDEYPRFVVAVVQRDQAAIHTAVQGRAIVEAQVTSTVPGQHAQGGWAQARFQRHIEVHMERHLQKVVQELHDMYYTHPYSRLAIGGTHEVAVELEKMLPHPIKRVLIGTFAVDFKHENEDAILQRALAVLQEDERRRERELVDLVVDAASSGNRGALGIDDTLTPLQEGRVDRLLLADGLTADGSTCLDCDYFSAQPFDRCPICGSSAEVTSDIIERAVERALLSGARVETVYGEPREWLLARGGMAALLRF